MFLGRVVGVVWSTVKWKELDGLRFLIVRPYSVQDFRRLSESGDRAGDRSAKEGSTTEKVFEGVVVADILGAGPGEDVIVSYGHAARAGIEEDLRPGQKPSRPVDAAVVAIVDRFEIDPISIKRRE